MVDKPRAVKLLDALRGALGDLDRYAASVTSDRLAADADTQNMVLHAIYRAIQASIDLAHHIVAEGGLPVPTTYRAVFASLADAKWIDPDLATRLAGWADLRNVIAHTYLEIDFDRVYTALDERSDLHRFASTMAKRIASESEP